MSELQPSGMDDLTGWHDLTCEQADFVYDRHKDLPGFVVESGVTDVDGINGSAVKVFREWWFNGHPLLRDYRYHDGRRCAHYGAMDDTAAKVVDDA